MIALFKKFGSAKLAALNGSSIIVSAVNFTLLYPFVPNDKSILIDLLPLSIFQAVFESGFIQDRVNNFQDINPIAYRVLVCYLSFVIFGCGALLTQDLVFLFMALVVNKSLFVLMFSLKTKDFTSFLLGERYARLIVSLTSFSSLIVPVFYYLLGRPSLASYFWTQILLLCFGIFFFGDNIFLRNFICIKFNRIQTVHQALKFGVSFLGVILIPGVSFLSKVFNIPSVSVDLTSMSYVFIAISFAAPYVTNFAHLNIHRSLKNTVKKFDLSILSLSLTLFILLLNPDVNEYLSLIVCGGLMFIYEIRVGILYNRFQISVYGLWYLLKITFAQILIALLIASLFGFTFVGYFLVAVLIRLLSDNIFERPRLVVA